MDPDIDAKLAALEREEDALAAEFEAAKGDAMEEEHLTAEEAATLEAIRDRKKKLVAAHRRKKKEGTNSAPMRERWMQIEAVPLVSFFFGSILCE